MNQKTHFLFLQKDPNAPKRPQTAFFLFAADFRAEVRAGLPDGSTVGEVAKELGRRWGSLGDDEKSKYQQASEKNKAQYEKDMEAYNNGLYGKATFFRNSVIIKTH